MSKFVIIGAGGFGREVLQLYRDQQAAQDAAGELLGFVDASIQGTLRGVACLGDDAWALEHLPRDVRVVVAMGDSVLREQVATRFEQAGFSPISLVHPSVRLSETVQVGAGSLLCAGSTLTTDIRLGRHVIINLHCTVGHDAVIEDFSTLSPGVHLSGGVYLGKANELGTGACVLPGVRLGDHCLLGAGAVATSSLEGGRTYVGVPARPLPR